MFKHLLFTLLFLLSPNLQAKELLQIEHPWIPEAPPGASIMAAYMSLYNPGNELLVIERIDSPDFKKVEMHLSKEVNGIAKMLPQKSLKIPPKAKRQLKPGSYHLMLIKPRKWFRNGDWVSIHLHFSNGDKQSLNLKVKKPSTTKTMKCAAGKCGR